MITLRGHHLFLLYGCMKSSNSEFSRENWEDSVIRGAISSRKTKRHGLHIIEVLNKALNPKEKIKLIDTVDDICQGCRFENRRRCREFIPYEGSATCGDRGALYFYGLQKRTYTSKFIQKRLDERGTN